MQVQNTNDSSVVSKLSSSKAGYFKDDCLSLFVQKAQKRSPIINRGYFIRFKAMENVFHTWFSLLTSKNSAKLQVISLGAGFDSTYFRLCCLDEFPSGCKYIEVDFFEVMKKKFERIKEFAENSLGMNFCDSCLAPAIVASAPDYVMLGLDLRDTEKLQLYFNIIGVSYDIPTLFISECAVTYIDVESSNNLIKWIQHNFCNSAFVAYEQIHPNDAFGIIMKNHFISIGCPLKSLLAYPNEKKQYSRYMELGWSNCCIIGMYNFYHMLPSAERLRVQDLELFDEFEMWHEKCHHYVLIWASQGVVSVPEQFQNKSLILLTENHWKKIFEWKLYKADKMLYRFGHGACLSSSGILISCGFGTFQQKHQRLGCLVVFDVISRKCSRISIQNGNEILGKRMFHTMTALSSGIIVIIGGRSAPKKAYKEIVILKSMLTSTEKLSSAHEDGKCMSERFQNANILMAVEQKAVLPVSVWRHSSTLVNIEGEESIVVFGGCSSDKTATNGCYILNVKSWNGYEVAQQKHTPSARHSHSASSHDSKIVITGGLTADETILNSVHVLDCEHTTWSSIHVAGLIPRYSHTSHQWNDYIILVGGITNIAGQTLGVGIINLTTLQAVELAAPAQDPEFPIFLSCHCSCLCNDEIIVLGGGGNCFSFGTHFNSRIVEINLRSLLCQIP